MTFPFAHDPLEAWPPAGSLKLERRGEGDWEFNYPRLTSVVFDYFEQAIGAWHLGEDELAEQRYRQLIHDYPEFIDAYHHLAMLLDEAEREEEAFALWQHTVRIGLEHLPEEFDFDAHRLPWIMLDNRPFLRAYHGLGLELLERGRTDKALQVFLRLLDLNPNDNQGVRSLAIDCFFELDLPERVLDICDRFAGDGMEHLVYGRPLALVKTGRLAEARHSMRSALDYLPLVGAELLKQRHRRPKSYRSDRVTHGGPDQAYAYWQDQGRHWRATSQALELLREVIGDNE